MVELVAYLSAKAVIKGEKVIVSSEKVNNPIAVYYGWANVPDVNLYYKDGLPASPFRTTGELKRKNFHFDK